MATAEVFANQPLTTVSSGGTSAPSSGTGETWTVASSSSFPAAATGTSQFHVCDTAAGKVSEIIAVTNVSGTTWTVTRGAESTTPVAHASGFTVQQVVTAGALGQFLQAAIDATAGDIQPVGTAASAGATGKAADAGHAHKGFARLATTGTAGFALQNATPNIISWTAPSDSAVHVFVAVSVAHVTSAETGGVIQVIYQSPITGAGNHFSQLLAGSLGTDTSGQTGTTIWGLVQPGTSVTVQQTTALTAGTATVYAELWGS